jgi:hypothetical protein
MKLKLDSVFLDQSRDIGCTQSRQFIASSTQDRIYIKQKDSERLRMNRLDKTLPAHYPLLKEIKRSGNKANCGVCFSSLLIFF